MPEATEREYSQIERDVFIGFYSIRKLMESTGKLSIATRESKHTVSWSPKKADAPIVDWYNRAEIWDLYDLDTKNQENRDLTHLSNRIVHSFIFSPCAADLNDPDGFYFTSDLDKEKRIYFIRTIEIANIFSMVGSDYPTSLESWRDAETGEMRLRTS